MSAKTDTTIREAVRDTIYSSALALDDQRWHDWLRLCDPAFDYAIRSFSPEINRDMIVVIQGLVILFMGALEQTFRPWLSALFFKAED